MYAGSLFFFIINIVYFKHFFGKLEETLKKKKKKKERKKKEKRKTYGKKIKDNMQMTDLPTSKAQLVLFIINNFNNCINLNTFFYFFNV